MNEQIYKLCETLIYEEDDFLVPVKKLYQLVKQEKEDFDVSYDEFLLHLKEHKDFNVIDILGKDIKEGLCPVGYEEKLEECGYFSGPLVYMAYDKLEDIEYLDILEEKINELIFSLNNILGVHENEQNQEKYDEVLSLIKRAEKIQDKITMIKKGM